MSTPSLHLGGEWSVVRWTEQTDEYGDIISRKPAEFVVSVTDRAHSLPAGDHLVVTSRKGKHSEVRIRKFRDQRECYDSDATPHITNRYTFGFLMPMERLWKPQKPTQQREYVNASFDTDDDF